MTRRAFPQIAVAALFVASTVIHAALADEQSVNATAMQCSVLATNGRSMVTLTQADRPVCSFYAQGALTASVESNETGGRWTGQIKHTPVNSESHTYNLAYDVVSSSQVSINDRSYRIRTEGAAAKADDAKPRCPTFVLTSYGRVVPTGRSFEVATAADLEPKTQFSKAWYFDRDLYGAETNRNTLEMDDLSGWVVGWDQQNPIQHSDGARIAKFRLFADGRLVINRGRRQPLAERKISPEEVTSLLGELAEMVTPPEDADEIDKLNVAVKKLNLGIAHSPLGRGLWDQGQDIVYLRDEGRGDTIRVIHEGRDQRPTQIPLGWEAAAQRLRELVAK